MSLNDWIIEGGSEGKRVQVIARIRNNETGEIRNDLHSSPYDDELGGVNPWWWSEGNASCDCNRYLFFQRCNDEPDDDDYPCSDGRYSVNLINPWTGEVFYREFEEPVEVKEDEQ